MEEEKDRKYQNIAIDSIVDPGLSMRSEITQLSVEDLAKSIKQVGLIEPVVVKKVGVSFEVIAGHRRLLACRIANLFFVPCRVVDVNDEMVETLKIHENLYREDVNVIDEAHFIENAMKHLKINIDKMAEVIGKSRVYVQQRLALLSYPDFLYNAIKDSKISFSVGKKLAQIEDIPTLKQYVEYAAQNGVTEDVASEWTRRWKVDKASVPGAPIKTIEEQSEIPQVPVMKVVCGLCQVELPLRDAKTFYCHFDCYKKVSGV